MELFHVIEDTFVILLNDGIYQQAKVYRRGDSLFGAWGAGFVRLMGSGGTSRPKVTWLALDDRFTARDRFGAPMLTGFATEIRVIA